MAEAEQKQIIGDIDWSGTLARHRDRLATLRAEIAEREAEAAGIEKAIPLLEQLDALAHGKGSQTATVRPGSTNGGGRRSVAVGKSQQDRRAREASAETAKQAATRTESAQERKTGSAGNGFRKAPGGGESKAARLARAIQDLGGSGSVQAIAEKSGLPRKNAGIALASAPWRFRRIALGQYALAEQVAADIKAPASAEAPPAPRVLIPTTPTVAQHRTYRDGGVVKCAQCHEQHVREEQFSPFCR